MSTNTTARPNHSSATTVGAAALCALAVTGIVTSVMFAFGSHASAAPAPITPAGPTPVSPSTPGHPTPDSVVKPSASIESLQRQLAQLNYYNGPITGIMNAQTTDAISYLQRDAKLPRTGVLNVATQNALTRYLITGNNQMAG